MIIKWITVNSRNTRANIPIKPDEFLPSIMKKAIKITAYAIARFIAFTYFLLKIICKRFLHCCSATGQLLCPDHESVEEFTEMADYPIQVDDRIVTAVKRELRPLLFERSLKRRSPSVVGTSFVPSHFHQIKTNPESAKIRKANLRSQRTLDEVAIALVFDRSGSMASGKKETIAQQTAAIFYKAL